jgi:hypothetical protein
MLSVIFWAIIGIYVFGWAVLIFGVIVLVKMGRRGKDEMRYVQKEKQNMEW